MAKRGLKKGMGHVTLYKGRYRVQPPIIHPPLCVCKTCKESRSPEEWHVPVERRINRASKFPLDLMKSIAYAAEVKREEERKLVEAVEEARRKNAALAGATRFGALCDLYREYQREEGKRYDRDKYRIDEIEKFFKKDRDASSFSVDDRNEFVTHLKLKRGSSPETVNRYLTTLIAILNLGKAEGRIKQHGMETIRRERRKRKKSRPKTFSKKQVEVLLGEAMNRFEREQAEERGRPVKNAGWRNVRRGSDLPLRGFCLIAFRTLMRPSNNFALRWEDVHIDAKRRKGWFELPEHKNSDKGVDVRAPLTPSLISYLLAIRPGEKAKGFIHPNPENGKPYTNIRKQWDRLIEIANEILPDEEKIIGRTFYHWRHTGASELVATGADPVMIVRMMGDVSLKTVMEHYFDSSLEHMQSIVDRWESTVPDERVEGTQIN